MKIFFLVFSIFLILSAAQHEGLIALQLQKQTFDKFLNASLEIFPQKFNNTKLDNISVSSDLLLYDINCSIVNASGIGYTLEFDNNTNNAIVNITNASLACFGKYRYNLALLSQEVIDFWDLVVYPLEVQIVVGLRQQTTKYNSALPSLIVENYTVVPVNQTLNIHGDLVKQFGSLVLPSKQETDALIAKSLNDFVGAMLQRAQNISNEFILEHFTRINMTDWIIYQPDVSQVPPYLNKSSANVFINGDIFQKDIGYQTINYDAVNLTFNESITNQTNASDMQILVSPQFLKELIMNYLQTVEHEEGSSINSLLNMNKVRVDQIIPTIRDPQQLTITNVSNDSIQLQLENYSIKVIGKFVNTSFDYDFTLDCSMNDNPTQILINFYSIINNYSMVMPQIHVQNIVAPIKAKNCKLDLHGGVFSGVVQEFIDTFALPTAIESAEQSITTVLPQIIDQKANSFIAQYYKPIDVGIRGLVINYTLANNVSVRSDAVIETNFNVMPEFNQ